MTVVPIRVRSRLRRYDADRGCFVYDICFKSRAQISD